MLSLNVWWRIQYKGVFCINSLTHAVCLHRVLNNHETIFLLTNASFIGWCSEGAFEHCKTRVPLCFRLCVVSVVMQTYTYVKCLPLVVSFAAQNDCDCVCDGCCLPGIDEYLVSKKQCQWSGTLFCWVSVWVMLISKYKKIAFATQVYGSTMLWTILGSLCVKRYMWCVRCSSCSFSVHVELLQCLYSIHGFKETLI